MALVACRECGREISNAALSCPYCGVPDLSAAAPELATKAKAPRSLGEMLRAVIMLFIGLTGIAYLLIVLSWTGLIGFLFYVISGGFSDDSTSTVTTTPASSVLAGSLDGRGQISATITPSPTRRAPSASDYHLMTLEDLKTDIRKMADGQRVLLIETIQPFADFAILKGSGGSTDATFVPVDINDLDRSSRKWLISDCVNGCIGRLRGHIGEVKGAIGVIGESLDSPNFARDLQWEPAGGYGEPNDPNYSLGKLGTGRLKVCKDLDGNEHDNTNKAIPLPSDLAFKDVGSIDNSNGTKPWLLKVALTESGVLRPGQACVSVKARVLKSLPPRLHPEMATLTHFKVKDHRRLEEDWQENEKLDLPREIEFASDEGLPPIYAIADTDFN